MCHKRKITRFQNQRYCHERFALMPMVALPLTATIFTNLMRYFLRSMRFALNGIYHFFRRERNGQIQGVIAVLVIAAGVFFKVSRMEWLALLLCTGLVIGLEMLNSAIERICNLYSTEFHPAIKIIKDVAAAAVLWSAIVSLFVGLIVFMPYVFALFRSVSSP